MINQIVKILCICVTLFIFTVLCDKNPVEDNTAPTPTGRAITGNFLDANNRPVAGAFVRLYPVDYVPSISLSKKAGVSIDTTDNNGNYRIPVSDSGTFNLEGQKDTLGVFVDSIVIPNDTDDVVIPDTTLKRLSIIKGISHMPGQNDTNQVRVTLYIPGTGRITKPVIGGKFSFSDVPEGKYQIIIDPTLNDYSVKIIDIIILSGDTLNLDTVEIKYSGKLLAPTNPNLTYDTLLRRVNLSWSPCLGSIGYNVYRKHIDSNLILINSGLCLDTLFIDSKTLGLIQDERYVYKVCCVDSTDIEGYRTAGDTVNVVSATTLLDSTSYQGYIWGIAIDSRNNAYLTDGTNNIIAVMDSSMTSVGTIERAFDFPVDIVIDSNDNRYIVDRDSIYKLSPQDSLIFRILRPHHGDGFELARLRLFKDSELWVKIHHWPLTSLYAYTLSGVAIDSITNLDIDNNGAAFNFDTSSNLLFAYSNRITTISRTGSIVNDKVFPYDSLPLFQGFTQIEFSLDSNIFLVDGANKEFYALDKQLDIQYKWDAGRTDFQINEVNGFRFDHKGYLWASEINKVRKYRVLDK